MMTVPLYRKARPHLRDEVALVDDEHYDEIIQFGTWYVHFDRRVSAGRAPRCYPAIYRGRSGANRILMHQLLVDYAVPDHADGNGLNNQLHNLRDATTAQNAVNSPKLAGCASVYKGVRRRGNSFSAQMWVGGKLLWIGSFGSDELAAARAYNEAALEVWGEFARLNVLPES